MRITWILLCFRYLPTNGTQKETMTENVTASSPGLTGRPSNHCVPHGRTVYGPAIAGKRAFWYGRCPFRDVGGYWIARSSRAKTPSTLKLIAPRIIKPDSRGTSPAMTVECVETHHSHSKKLSRTAVVCS